MEEIPLTDIHFAAPTNDLIALFKNIKGDKATVPTVTIIVEAITTPQSVKARADASGVIANTPAGLYDDIECVMVMLWSGAHNTTNHSDLAVSRPKHQ